MHPRVDLQAVKHLPRLLLDGGGSVFAESYEHVEVAPAVSEPEPMIREVTARRTRRGLRRLTELGPEVGRPRRKVNPGGSRVESSFLERHESITRAKVIERTRWKLSARAFAVAQRERRH